uniref:Uncharacterized protein AlNc14C114G6469 n=1 Tax=Albugo laibachii Nc14 TaxID=890382 RepID=F0WIT4_9STRA|nr:conserved hypothetical protein [Albugo laibachii Nc14]|eukprot:CCA21178.1 conserved hypothetical protein [Albugo laibachii Nc14]
MAQAKRQSLYSSLPLLDMPSRAPVSQYKRYKDLQKAENNVINDPTSASEPKAAHTHNSLRISKPTNKPHFLLSSASAERLKKFKSEAFDPFAERELIGTMAQTSDEMHRDYLLSESGRIMEEWIGVYDQEKHQFTSYALFIESKLDHIQQSLISVVGRPHALETAACCATLWKMPGLLSCYQSLLQKLAVIVQSAVYGPSTPIAMNPQRMTMQDLVRYFYQQPAYFDKVQTLKAQYETYRNLKDPLVVKNLPWRDLLTIVGSTPLDSLIDAIISVLPTSRYSLLINKLTQKRLANQKLEITRQKRPWKIFVSRPDFADAESITKQPTKSSTNPACEEKANDVEEIVPDAEELRSLTCTQIARVISVSAHAFSASGREMLVQALIEGLETESFKDVFKLFEAHAKKLTLGHLELPDILEQLSIVVRQAPEVPEVLFQLYLAMYSIDQKIVRGREAQIKLLFFGRLLSSNMDSFFLSDLAQHLSKEHWAVLSREMEALHPKKSSPTLKNVSLFSDRHEEKEEMTLEEKDHDTAVHEVSIDTFDQLQNLLQDFLAEKQVHSARLSQMIRLVLIPKLSNEKNIQSVLKGCWDRLTFDMKLQQFQELFATFANESQFSKISNLQLLDTAFTTLNLIDKKKWLQEKQVLGDEPQEISNDDDAHQLESLNLKMAESTVQTKFKWTECALKHLVADEHFLAYEGKLLKIIRKIQSAKSPTAKMNITAATHAIEQLLLPFGNLDRQKISQRLAEKMAHSTISFPLTPETSINPEEGKASIKAKEGKTSINLEEEKKSVTKSLENYIESGSLPESLPIQTASSTKAVGGEVKSEEIRNLIKDDEKKAYAPSLEPHCPRQTFSSMNTATIATQTTDSISIMQSYESISILQPSDSICVTQSLRNGKTTHKRASVNDQTMFRRQTVNELQPETSSSGLSLRTLLSPNANKKKRGQKINQHAVPRAISGLVTSWQMNVDQLAQFSKKTISAVLRSIAEAYGDFLTAERRKKMSVSESSTRIKKLTLAKVVYQSFLHSYGLPGIADIHLVALSIAVEHYRSTHLRVDFFAQFFFEEAKTKEFTLYLEFLEYLVCGETTKTMAAPSGPQASSQSASAPRQRIQRIVIPDKEVWLVSIEKAQETAEYCFRAMRKQCVYHFCEKIAKLKSHPTENGVNVDVLLQLVLQEWKDEQVRRNNYLRDAFHAGDVDGDGQLTSAEFSKIVLSIDRDRDIGDILLMYSDTLRQTESNSIDANTFLQVAREYDLDKVPWDEDVELHTICNSIEDLDATWILGGVRGFFLGTLDSLSSDLSPAHPLRLCEGAGCGCLKCIVDGYIGFQRMRIDARASQDSSNGAIVSDELVWKRFWHLMRQLHDATEEGTHAPEECSAPRSNTSRRNAVPNFLFPNLKRVSGALGQAHDREVESFESEHIRTLFSHLYVQER